MSADRIEDVIVDASDEQYDECMPVIETGDDIEIDEDVILFYEGAPEGFWEHVRAWGQSVIGELIPYYNLLATTSDMLVARNPIDADGDDEKPLGADFAQMTGHLLTAGHGELALQGCPKVICDLLPFRVSFSYPTMEIVTYDIPAMDWFVTVMMGFADDLWSTEQPCTEVHEFIPDTSWEENVLSPETYATAR